MNCKSCNGTGKIDISKLERFSLEMRALHIPASDTSNEEKIREEGGKCRTCSGSGVTMIDFDEKSLFVCDNCSHAEVGEYSKVAEEWVKPAHWFIRMIDNEFDYACSKKCAVELSEKTNTSKTILPW